MVKVVKLQSFGSGNGAIDTLGVEPKGYVNSGTDEDTGHGRKLFEGQSIHGDTVGIRMHAIPNRVLTQQRHATISNCPAKACLFGRHTFSHPACFQAAKRRAITELLFFASVGDVRRMQRIVRIWGLVIADPSCCDYDRRTPL
jgi:hypothetical protein